MTNIPNLSDLKTPMSTTNASDIIASSDTDLEFASVKSKYNFEMDTRKNELKNKIEHLEKKLSKQELKEGMLDMIIGQTYTELENLKENEFAKRGQKQSILIKQLEALSVLHDTILKYEDMIQKYHKILMDIENNKLNSYLKIENLKKEEKQTDEGLGDILQELQQMLKGETGSITSNSLLDEIQQELNEENY
jgi:hypothetical protein